MGVHDRIRQLVSEAGGRVPADRIVREVLGLAGGNAMLSKKLLQATLRDMRGLELDGSDVVEGTAPMGVRRLALALAPAASSTALPPVAAWVESPAPASGPVIVSLAGDAWKEGVVQLARDLAGAEVYALSAASARRVLRLGSRLAGLDADDEPQVIALGQVARALGRPLRGADDAAALVGASAPENPEQAALLLGLLVEKLAELAGGAAASLRDLADKDVVAPFEFGERAFGRERILELPEAPGVYFFEDVEGDVVYVGKAQNLRRRVGQYFQAKVDERDARVREAAHDVGVERSGTELSALLREQQLIRELHPTLNVQEQVRDRERSSVAQVGARGAVAVVQPSSDGGAEIVLLDRERGAEIIEVVADVAPEAATDAVLSALNALRSRRADADALADVQIALTWLADKGAAASLVDASGEPEAVAELLVRVARDPDLKDGRIVVT